MRKPPAGSPGTAAGRAGTSQADVPRAEDGDPEGAEHPLGVREAAEDPVRTGSPRGRAGLALTNPDSAGQWTCRGPAGSRANAGWRRGSSAAGFCSGRPSTTPRLCGTRRPPRSLARGAQGRTRRSARRRGRSPSTPLRIRSGRVTESHARFFSTASPKLRPSASSASSASSARISIAHLVCVFCTACVQAHGTCILPCIYQRSFGGGGGRQAIRGITIYHTSPLLVRPQP